MNTEQYLFKLLTDAGWCYGREFEVKTKTFNSFSAAYNNAVKILSQYGGLNVGEVGPGREVSASNICF